MRINKQDYRFFEWEEVPIFVEEREKLKQSILKRHPRLKNFYKFFNERERLFYKSRFMVIFSNRCCYCGVSFLRVLNGSNVQIDHIYSKSNNDKSFDINAIENLAPSCNVCNSRKSNIVKTKSFAKKISPYTLSGVFERTNDFSIRVSNAFVHDKDIVSFYNALNLASEFYRLSYFYEYFVIWLINCRHLVSTNNYYRLMIIAFILGEIVRSNANYHR